MADISFDIRSKIIAQAAQEIAWARDYKQGKTAAWEQNETLYYGVKQQKDATGATNGTVSPSNTARTNVDLGRMAEFVHTLLSKIDNPLEFTFTKTKESQRKRVERLNALRTRDAKVDNWDIKDIAGKKQAIIYGRAIYSYAADSENGYAPHLDNVDVYDFLIDPSGGGIDLEKAMYMGRYGVIKSKNQLKAGVKSGEYNATETNKLIAGKGNATETTTETTNTNSRTADQGTGQTDKQISDPNKYKFWEWYTTYDGTAITC